MASQQEAVFDGVLHWRQTPDDPWQRMTPERLTKLLQERAGKMALVEGAVSDFHDALDRREAAPYAMDKALRAIENALGMERRRKSLV